MNDSYFYDRDGNPLTGKAPLQVFLQGAPDAVAAARGAANRVVNGFLDEVRAGGLNVLSRTVMLPNGGKVTMTHVQGVTRVVVEAGEGRRDEPPFYGGILIRPTYLSSRQSYLDDATDENLNTRTHFKDAEKEGRDMRLRKRGRPGVPGLKDDDADDIQEGDLAEWLIVQIAKNKKLSAGKSIKNGAVRIFRIASPKSGQLTALAWKRKQYLVSTNHGGAEFYLCGKKLLKVPPMPNGSWGDLRIEDMLSSGQARMAAYGFRADNFERGDRAGGVIFIAIRNVLWAYNTLDSTWNGEDYDHGEWQTLATGGDPDGMNDFGTELKVEVISKDNGSTKVSMRCSGSNGYGSCSEFTANIDIPKEGSWVLSGSVTIQEMEGYETGSIVNEGTYKTTWSTWYEPELKKQYKMVGPPDYAKFPDPPDGANKLATGRNGGAPETTTQVVQPGGWHGWDLSWGNARRTYLGALGIDNICDWMAYLPPPNDYWVRVLPNYYTPPPTPTNTPNATVTMHLGYLAQLFKATTFAAINTDSGTQPKSVKDYFTKRELKTYKSVRRQWTYDAVDECVFDRWGVQHRGWKNLRVASGDEEGIISVVAPLGANSLNYVDEQTETDEFADRWSTEDLYGLLGAPRTRAIRDPWDAPDTGFTPALEGGQLPAVFGFYVFSSLKPGPQKFICGQQAMTYPVEGAIGDAGQIYRWDDNPSTQFLKQEVARPLTPNAGMSIAALGDYGFYYRKYVVAYSGPQPKPVYDGMTLFLLDSPFGPGYRLYFPNEVYTNTVTKFNGDFFKVGLTADGYEQPYQVGPWACLVDMYRVPQYAAVIKYRRTVKGFLELDGPMGYRKHEVKIIEETEREVKWGLYRYVPSEFPIDSTPKVTIEYSDDPAEYTYSIEDLAEFDNYDYNAIRYQYTQLDGHSRALALRRERGRNGKWTITSQPRQTKPPFTQTYSSFQDAKDEAEEQILNVQLLRRNGTVALEWPNLLSRFSAVIKDSGKVTRTFSVATGIPRYSSAPNLAYPIGTDIQQAWLRPRLRQAFWGTQPPDTPPELPPDAPPDTPLPVTTLYPEEWTSMPANTTRETPLFEAGYPDFIWGEPQITPARRTHAAAETYEDVIFHDARTGGYIVQVHWRGETEEGKKKAFQETWIGNDLGAVKLHDVLNEWKALGTSNGDPTYEHPFIDRPDDHQVSLI